MAWNLQDCWSEKMGWIKKVALGVGEAENHEPEATVWTTAMSLVNIIRDLIIYPGASLTIEAGVQVIFAGCYNILVRSTLLIDGTAAAPVDLDGGQGSCTGYGITATSSYSYTLLFTMPTSKLFIHPSSWSIIANLVVRPQSSTTASLRTIWGMVCMRAVTGPVTTTTLPTWEIARSATICGVFVHVPESHELHLREQH